MNEDHGSYVTKTQWKPVFNDWGGAREISPSFGFVMTIFGHDMIDSLLLPQFPIVLLSLHIVPLSLHPSNTRLSPLFPSSPLNDDYSILVEIFGVSDAFCTCMNP